MEEEEEGISANSEIRFISLELMKLAYKSKKSFRQIAQEYIDNTSFLQELIAEQGQAQKKSGKRVTRSE